MHAAAEFAAERVRVFQFHRAEARMTDMCEHNFAGHAVAAQGRHQHTVGRRSRFADQVGVRPLVKGNAPAIRVGPGFAAVTRKLV